jgi:2-C-methyl-D-erythritol 4-phosphate cytidylyltransferase
VGVVVPAAGVGRRLGGGVKALHPLAGRALLAHALEALEANRCTAAVVVVGHPEALEATAKLLAEEGFAKVTALVGGGPTRQASVAAGLRALPPEPRAAGVVPGVPVTDTIRGVDAARRSTGIVDRDLLRARQTPQLFVRAVLEEAHQLARVHRDLVDAPDEVALVELVGHPVQVVPGDPENLKVTTPLDLALAEELLARRGWSGSGPGRPWADGPEDRAEP